MLALNCVLVLVFWAFRPFLVLTVDLMLERPLDMLGDLPLSALLLGLPALDLFVPLVVCLVEVWVPLFLKPWAKCCMVALAGRPALALNCVLGLVVLVLAPPLVLTVDLFLIVWDFLELVVVDRDRDGLADRREQVCRLTR